MKRLSHPERALRRQEIAARIAGGESTRALSIVYGMSHWYIQQIGNGIARPQVTERALAALKRKMQLREFHALGQTQGSFRRLTGIVGPVISTWARDLGLKFRKDIAGWEPVVAASRDRASVMATLYRDGYTLEQVGAQFGVTRERVRQLIGKHFRMTGADGGKRALAKASAERRLRKKNARYFAKYGCGVDDVLAVRAEYGSKPTYAFQQQRRNARERGIGWDLTFWSWWTIWRDSGHWHQRGRGQGYCMCRNGDSGPYAVGNVFIATAAENSADGQINKGRKKNPELPIGVRRVKSGRYAAHRNVNGKSLCLGTHDTPEQAYAAYLMAAPTQSEAA